jgi:hypothetical protein
VTTSRPNECAPRSGSCPALRQAIPQSRLIRHPSRSRFKCCGSPPARTMDSWGSRALRQHSPGRDARARADRSLQNVRPIRKLGRASRGHGRRARTNLRLKSELVPSINRDYQGAAKCAKSAVGENGTVGGNGGMSAKGVREEWLRAPGLSCAVVSAGEAWRPGSQAPLLVAAESK